mmetsp:Transcript_24775/g.77879  ORF Transcript_24775/g.77879 Transcript_24775/m.77879 type:complete len:507 (+) Transcript_24775:3-1523(+)
MRHEMRHPAVVMALAHLLPGSLAGPTSFDLLVVGGGSAGLTAAKFAARFGKSVALIERERLGGDCTWTGCVPSKTLLASAERAHALQTAAEFGVAQPATVSVEMAAVKARIGRTIGQIYDADDSPEALRALGIETVSGAATLVDTRRVSVSSGGGGSATVYEATKGIVLATGARPRPLDIRGIASVPHLTYEGIFSLDTLPERLTVVGGGPVGCELAQAFARLGSSVTLVAPRLLPGHEPEASDDLAAALRADGVALVAARAAAVEARAGGGHALTCSDGSVVEGTSLLSAVGRVPVTEGLGLSALGVELSAATGGIAVDAKLRTTVKGVYAAGDCTGDQQYTHYAGFQGAIAARNILLPLSDQGVATSRVPGCVFTSPEIAKVGLTESEARAEGKAGGVAVAYRRMGQVDRAVTMGEASLGFLKVVYEPRSGAILGATVMGPSAGELISEISVAMAGKVKLPALASIMHAYPTVSIALQQLAAEVYYNQLEASMPLYNALSRLGL